MKHEIAQEYSSFMTPDSLRQTLQMLKQFYDSHTKKNFSCEDSDGSKYAGTMENFGTEILLETRKLLMNKPALQQFLTKNTTDFYFDITYSNMINTYDQENMLIATLKKNVLIDDAVYELIFENCDEKCVIRSESWGDSSTELIYNHEHIGSKRYIDAAYKEYYYHTKSNPTLKITLNTGDVQSIPLIIKGDDNENSTDYYFYKGHLYLENDDFITSYENGTLTITLDRKMETLPCIWICLDILKTLPPFKLNNAMDQYDRPLFALGTDGDGITYIFPTIFDAHNIPYELDTQTNPFATWKLRAIFDESDINVIGDFNNPITDYRYSARIKEVQWIATTNGLITDPNAVIARTIRFPSDDIKVTLTTVLSTNNWIYTKPKQGDIFYDGITYKNPLFAYIDIDAFSWNYRLYEPYAQTGKQYLVPAFEVKINQDYPTIYDDETINAYSGIHVDVGSEHSENGISKKYGVIHNLGDFDGLPDYYQEYLDKNIQRSRVELYTIKDQNHNTNQTIFDKGAAAIFVDAALPQSELANTLLNLNTVIVYDFSRPNTYTTRGKSISSNNALTEITYISNSIFGNVKMSGNYDKQKFIYHGKRHFSLKTIGFDPEKEIGRVYAVTNDPISYINEEKIKSIDKRPLRTLSRICDIPTSFAQLVHIENLSPTLVLDDYYVRTQLNFQSNDIDRLYNTLPQIAVLRGSKPVFGSETELLDALKPNLYCDQDSINNQYHLWSNTFGLTIPLDKNIIDFSFNVLVSGNRYAIGDKFMTIIGGLCLEGTVTGIQSGTGVSDINIITDNTQRTIEWFKDDDNNITYVDTTDHSVYKIPIENINHRWLKTGDGDNATYEVDLKTTTVTGNGTGLRVSLLLPGKYINDHKMQLNMNRYRNDIISFSYDEFGFLWIYRFDETNKTFVKKYQLTGEQISDNQYGSQSEMAITKRELSDVFIYNIFKDTHFESESNFGYIIPNVSNIFGYSTWRPAENIQIETILTDHKIDEDLSDDLSRFNKCDTMYYLKENGYSDGKWRYNVYCKHYRTYGSEILFPRFHHMNIGEYANTASKLISTNHYEMEGQPYQLDIYFLNPLKTTMDDYQYISKDLYKRIKTNEITFNDYFSNDVIDELGELTTNVYTFDQYQKTTDILNFEKTIGEYTRDELIDHIIHNISTIAEPLQYEDTDYKWDNKSLITYILTHSVNIHDKAEIKILRYQNEKVVNETKPVGKQPSGAIVPLSAEIVNDKVYYGSTAINIDQFFLFKLEDPGKQYMKSLTGFAMKDEMNFDISDKCIILFKNDLYILTDKENYIWSKIVFK